MDEVGPHVVLVQYQSKVMPLVAGDGQSMAVFKSAAAARAWADTHPLCQAGIIQIIYTPFAKVNA